MGLKQNADGLCQTDDSLLRDPAKPPLDRIIPVRALGLGKRDITTGIFGLKPSVHILFFSVLFGWCEAHETPADSIRAMLAVRVNSPAPKIDGLLNDAAWQIAPKFSGFRQREPDEGKAATERTAVQVAYDDEAIYLGFMCYDSAPDSIVAPLARKDRWLESDRIELHLDPFHDHRTGAFFIVGPSSWTVDGILFKDTWDDDTWDGVWTARAAIVDSGWSAEYQIPYRVLRFGPKARYTWGINVTRKISRKRERVRWQWKPTDEPGWVSRFGHLTGIKGVRPKRALEVIPYVVGRSSFVPQSESMPSGREHFGSMGVDARYGLTSNISINATINPDFGQVKADPSVLNLGVFETFFGERRPFFVEGDAIFKSSSPGIVGIDGPVRLFHSRRIGKRPGRFDTPDGQAWAR